MDSAMSGTSVEKHHYMALFMSGVAVLSAVAMQSGCTFKKMQDSSQMRYWFDHLVQLGVGTPQQEKHWRRHEWKICFLIEMLETARRCCFCAAPPL
jgi:hypothetical protein